ncbi:Uncharacterized protein QTN25_001546 [Entamoeba marina]
MEEFPTAQPIPQHHFHIDEANSSITPSSFSFKIDQFIPNNSQFKQNNFPPPDSNPIPFDSVDFSRFHAEFDSPTTMECDGPTDNFSYQSEDTFSYHL